MDRGVLSKAKQSKTKPSKQAMGMEGRRGGVCVCRGGGRARARYMLASTTQKPHLETVKGVVDEYKYSQVLILVWM